LKGWKGLKKAREENRIRKILSLDEVVLSPGVGIHLEWCA
jgi:hypothetical protein